MTAGGYKMLRIHGRDRLHLVEALAGYIRPTWHALIGFHGGDEIMALITGIRRACRDDKQKPLNRLRCYHWQVGEKAARRLLDAHEKRRKNRYGYTEIVQFVANGEGRQGWHEDAAHLVERGQPAFGMILHAGTGRAEDIRGDLTTLLPLIDDNTLIVLLSSRSDGARQQFARMVYRKGWLGIWEREIGMLKMPVAQRKEL